MINHAMQRIRALEDRLDDFEQRLAAIEGGEQQPCAPKEPKQKGKPPRARRKPRVLPGG